MSTNIKAEIREQCEHFLILHRMAHDILQADVSWEDKYDLIFSEYVSIEALALFSFEWVDPDSTYEEDVTAFMKAFDAKAEIVQTLRDTMSA